MRAAHLFQARAATDKSVKAYKMYITLTCKDRPEGTSLKSLNLCLEVQLGNDPFDPSLTLTEHGNEHGPTITL